jgi:hypothetical protein
VLAAIGRLVHQRLTGAEITDRGQWTSGLPDEERDTGDTTRNRQDGKDPAKRELSVCEFSDQK